MHICGNMHFNSQLIADKVVEWSSRSRFQLDGEKYKELRISFTKKETRFSTHCCRWEKFRVHH